MSRTVSAAAVVLLTASWCGCSLVVHFKDPPEDAGAESSAETESGTIVPPEVDGSIRSDAASSEIDASPPSDATVVPDTAVEPFTCNGKPDGTEVPGTSSRCCGYEITHVDTNDNCGACGIACNTSKGQNCVNRDGHFYCAGCALDGGGGDTACWSGCCVMAVFSQDGVCTPEFPCRVPVFPQCNDDLCRTKGNASCHTNAGTGTYCSY